MCMLGFFLPKIFVGIFAYILIVFHKQGKLELTKLSSTITININPAEKEFLSQPDGEKPDSAKVR